MTCSTRTVVVGGGIAGLATATLLAREGHEVQLLERLPRVGGRAGTLERDGFRFDTGPSWYLMPNVFDHFFELLGTSTGEQLDLRTLSPAYRVFSEPHDGGRPVPLTVPLGSDKVMETFERVEPGSSKQLATYLASARNTSDMAERFFLYNPFTRLKALMQPEVVRSLPELAKLLAMPLEKFIANRFQDPVLRQVLGYPAVFLGTNPADAPAMYHLMSALDLGDGVQYPMGGFWHLVERLEALALEAGVRIRTEAQVLQITTREAPPKSRERFTPRGHFQRPAPLRVRKTREVTGVKWCDSEGGEHFSVADIVVSGADLHHTETKLLDIPDRSYPRAWWQRRTSGPGAVLVMLGVRGNLPELPHHSLFFTRDWEANFSAIFGKPSRVPDPASIYVCKPSATDPGVAPKDHENLFVLVPIPADPSLGAGGAEGGGDALIEGIADAAIDQIADWAGIPDLRERIVVRHTIGPADFARDYNSWRGGMLGPAHTLGQSAMFRAQNASKKVNGLYYAGATTAPGVGVPMCLISAELVLKRIRGDHSPGPTRVQHPAWVSGKVG
ncbi:MULTISPECIES: phytoene desaturase family protein [Paenarthrobacter]|uniref:phytoene desaturase family protein n=1 Tax=Paenarthrobacter TaxID=1742992 RepID=UPI00074D48FB|nr:phytoene desaturase family protein [Paenarthrobacter ureafaciens]AMB39024.1 phytoene dehydrogenase [Arthrobacter sp. ATCC 21022]KUR64073.1 phytoene dehydrogenase [Arthrobacter sp. ATCC 21022]RWW95233.1 phytoene desaturase [Paenarthrobacter ureafaciens]